MLRIDGVLKSQLDKSHPIHNIIKGAQEALKMMRLPTFTLEEVKTKESYDAEGNKQHSNGCWMNCSQLYRHDGIDYRIEYYETISGSGDKEMLIPQQLEFDGTGKPLQDVSTDEVFFTIFVARQCERIEELAQYQNEISSRRDWQYTLVRREMNARDKMARDREEAELRLILYNLENDHDKLLDVCYNLHIEPVNKKDWELVEQLANIVLFKDKQGHFNRDMIERFRSIVKPGNPAESKLADLWGFVGKLMNSGILYPAGTANGAWYLDEEKTNKLCQWSSRNGNNAKQESLANYFLTHKDEIPIYEEKMKQLTPA